MARCKNSPEIQQTKCDLAERLREVRTEIFGERGGPELSRQLGLPVRTWYNYEVGVTVPAEVLLRFVELTNVEPIWLLHGRGPKFRKSLPVEHAVDAPAGAAVEMLRQALSLLEQAEAGGRGGSLDSSPPESDAEVLLRVRTDGESGREQPAYLRARREWVEGQPDCRCVRVRGRSMEPLLADGAFVAFAAAAEEPEGLDGELVALRHDGRWIVRRLQLAGRFALLRAENAEQDDEILPIDLDEIAAGSRPFRRVLWVTTPHGQEPRAAALARS